MRLEPNELLLLELFSLSEKDAKRLYRMVEDISLRSGMGDQEIIDFLKFGAEEEFKTWKQDYNWASFQKSIEQKLSKS
jgi:hypothetical protein